MADLQKRNISALAILTILVTQLTLANGVFTTKKKISDSISNYISDSISNYINELNC